MMVAEGSMSVNQYLLAEVRTLSELSTHSRHNRCGCGQVVRGANEVHVPIVHGSQRSESDIIPGSISD